VRGPHCRQAHLSSRMKFPLRSVLVVTVVALVAVGAALYQRRAGSAATDAARAPTPSPQASPTAAAAAAALELDSLDVVAAQRVSMSSLVNLSGSLRATRSAWVKARVPGELRSLTVREGDPVRAGQVIGQIETTELDLRIKQAEQQAQAAQAQLDIASRTLQNNRGLVQQGFISATALEASVANEAAARATFQAAQSAVLLVRKSRADAVLTAPLTGLIAQRMAQAGERVGVDARIVEVVDLSRLELEAAVAPHEAAQLAIGQRAQLTVEGWPTSLAATIERISPTAQAGSRSVLVYLTLPTTPGLRQGLYARGHVAVRKRTVLAVPASAVRQDRDRPTVLSVEGGRVVPRAVALGERGPVDGPNGGLAAHDAMWVEVLEGVSERDVLLGATVGSVRDGALVKLPATATKPPTP
jgi:membrane fusion protein, multidrug efflux system